MKEDEEEIILTPKEQIILVQLRNLKSKYGGKSLQERLDAVMNFIKEFVLDERIKKGEVSYEMLEDVKKTVMKDLEHSDKKNQS